jgi:hypothetical protein
MSTSHDGSSDSLDENHRLKDVLANKRATEAMDRGDTHAREFPKKPWPPVVWSGSLFADREALTREMSSLMDSQVRGAAA